MLRFTYKSQASVLYCCGCATLCNLPLHPPGTTTVVTEFDMGKYSRSTPTRHPTEIPNLFIRVSDTEVEPSTATCQSCKSTFSRRHRVGVLLTRPEASEVQLLAGRGVTFYQRPSLCRFIPSLVTDIWPEVHLLKPHAPRPLQPSYSLQGMAVVAPPPAFVSPRPTSYLLSGRKVFP